ncbi:MAG: hypothetical protein OEZ37_07595, partial [Gemmatimonadota bacterium]|nr:hypothetical protein [Gemmatimonadota bacterium]
RAWGYALAEVVSWAVYLERRGAGARATRAYVDFAWSEARLQTGPRQDGEFAYYETMAHWLRSGAWDRDSGVAGVQPETDGTTYNGMLWNRAMALYGSDGVMGGAGYDEALRYYRERAISEGFLFDWSARPELQDVYVGLIHDSNQRYREATLVLGAVFLNHVVSAADAFVSSRVGRAGDPSHLSVSPDRAFPGRWVVAMTVPVGP